MQSQIPIVLGTGEPAAVIPLLIAAFALLALGVVLLVLIGVTLSQERPGDGGFLRAFAVVSCWILIIIAMVFLFLLLGPFLVVILVIYFRRLRARQQAMLWGLAVAAERGIPLTPAIEAFASEHWGLARWSARSLARLVAAGTPLPDALAFVGGMVPREALVPIRVGHELGALSAGLRQAAAPAGPQESVSYQQQSVWDQLAIRIFYLCVVILSSTVAITFMMLKIAPAFHKIFADFGAELPAISRFMIGIIPSFAIPWELLLLAVCFLLFFYLPLRYFRVITWDLPFMGRFTRKLHSATILESLALTAERNQPFPRTIATLARCYPKWSIRWRLQGTLVDVTTGTDWAASLHARGVISRADRAVLQAAQRVGNLAWALREIADSMRRRAAYRLQAWVHLLFPAAVVSLAIFVMAFYAAFFLPLIALISRLT